MEGDVVTLQDLFVAAAGDDGDGYRMNGRTTLLGPLRSTGLIPNFMPKLLANGVDVASRVFEEALA